jgi:hypothetical protein
MIETAYGELAQNHAPADPRLGLEALDIHFESSAQRATHRLTGIKLALVLSLGLWGAIGYGIWAAVHAFA